MNFGKEQLSLSTEFIKLGGCDIYGSWSTPSPAQEESHEAKQKQAVETRRVRLSWVPCSHA